jgi:hypothetical protein
MVSADNMCIFTPEIPDALPHRASYVIMYTQEGVYSARERVRHTPSPTREKKHAPTKKLMTRRCLQFHHTRTAYALSRQHIGHVSLIANHVSAHVAHRAKWPQGNTTAFRSCVQHTTHCIGSMSAVSRASISWVSRRRIQPTSVMLRTSCVTFVGGLSTAVFLDNLPFGPTARCCRVQSAAGSSCRAPRHEHKQPPIQVARGRTAHLDTRPREGVHDAALRVTVAQDTSPKTRGRRSSSWRAALDDGVRIRVRTNGTRLCRLATTWSCARRYVRSAVRVLLR